MINALLQLLLAYVVCARADKAAVNKAVCADNCGIGLGSLVLQPVPDSFGITVFFVSGNIFFRRQNNFTVCCLHCLLYIGGADRSVV